MCLYKMWHWFKDIFSLFTPPPHHSYLSHIYLMLETTTGHTSMQKVDFLPLCTGLATPINLLGGFPSLLNNGTECGWC